MTPARIAFALCAVVATMAASAVPSVATGAPRPQPPALHLGHHGIAVRTLQQRLITLGYLPPGNVNGLYGMRTWHAVVAFQGWQRLSRDGIVGRRTRTALASAHRPRPWVPLKHGLELDLARQVLLVVNHGQTRRAIHISSAAPGYVTPRGRFDVYRRERMSWSFPYQTWMPYALYFSGGYAVHGFDSVPAYPASHGCVRMPLMEAPFVYVASPLHTPVVIR
jgi:Putative peptidoglycan binding domain/L,D-transpeptidase catalytic domain